MPVVLSFGSKRGSRLAPGNQKEMQTPKPSGAVDWSAPAVSGASIHTQRDVRKAQFVTMRGES